MSKVNDLLERLEAAFQRERRTTANIAHELGTPIAELRAVAEAAGRWPDNAELRARTVDEAARIAVQMERIVRTLLVVARGESGAAPIEGVALGPLVASCWAALAAEADARRIRLQGPELDGVRVRAGPELLRMLLRNLLENAVQYAVLGSEIRCRSRIAQGALRLSMRTAPRASAPRTWPSCASPSGAATRRAARARTSASA